VHGTVVCNESLAILFGTWHCRVSHSRVMCCLHQLRATKYLEGYAPLIIWQ